MIRIVLSILPAFLVVLSLFWGLQGMVRVGKTPDIRQETLHMVDFIRLKKEQVVVKKERLKPKKPTPKKVLLKPKIDIRKAVDIVKQPVLMEKINPELPMDFSAVSALGDAQVSGFGTQEISTNVLPVSTINPLYPKRAKMMKKEGYVRLEFTITEFGTVRGIKVVESKPPQLFDASATSALLKWKFKPKVVANQAVEQRAMIKIDYRLNK